MSSCPSQPHRRRNVIDRHCPVPVGPETTAAAAQTTAATARCAPPASSGGITGSAAVQPALLPSAPPTPPPSALRTAPAAATRSANISRTREITCVASSEWPPSSKKLSCTPTARHPQHLAPDPRQQFFHRRPRLPHTTHSRCPYAPPPAPAARCRSTFPFGVSGNSSSSTNCAGTMYSGNCSCRCSRNSAC